MIRHEKGHPRRKTAESPTDQQKHERIANSNDETGIADPQTSVIRIGSDSRESSIRAARSLLAFSLPFRNFSFFPSAWFGFSGFKSRSFDFGVGERGRRPCTLLGQGSYPYVFPLSLEQYVLHHSHCHEWSTTTSPTMTRSISIVRFRVKEDRSRVWREHVEARVQGGECKHWRASYIAMSMSYTSASALRYHQMSTSSRYPSNVHVVYKR